MDGKREKKKTKLMYSILRLLLVGTHVFVAAGPRLMLAGDGFVVGIPLCWFQGAHAASTRYGKNTDSN